MLGRHPYLQYFVYLTKVEFLLTVQSIHIHVFAVHEEDAEPHHLNQRATYYTHLFFENYRHHKKNKVVSEM